MFKTYKIHTNLLNFTIKLISSIFCVNIVLTKCHNLSEKFGVNLHMKIFDKILGFLGFDVEEDETVNNKSKIIKNAENSFNPIAKKPTRSVKKDFFILSSETSEIEYFNLKPKNQTEIQSAMNVLKNGNNVIINLAELKEPDFLRALDFVSGYCYCLDASVEKIEKTTFKLTVKNDGLKKNNIENHYC